MSGSGFAFWFLPFTIVIGLWVAWSDMKTMKIPNRAVLALLAVYLVVGPLALPFQVWLWGWVVGLGAFATHRIFGFIPPLRRRFAWESWDQPGFPFRSDFPMGLALAGILNFYLLSTILPHF